MNQEAQSPRSRQQVPRTGTPAARRPEDHPSQNQQTQKSPAQGRPSPQRRPVPQQRSAVHQRPDVQRPAMPAETVIRLKGAPDRIFMVLVLLLVCLGTAMVFSASYAYAEYHFDDSLYYIRSQIIWAIVGFAVMFVATLVDYRWYQQFSVPAFVVSLVLLGLVPFIGKTVNGAKRWLVVGPIQLQPSEVVKFTLVLILALYVAANRGKMNTFRYGILFPYAIIGTVCFITALEKHLSATMILLIIGTLVIYIGGAPAKWLGTFLALGGIIVALLIAIFPYARLRVMYWLHPENDPDSSGYQLLQSIYAIGSGGWLGEGLGNSRQKYLYLPESQNDFIFSVICEEFGYIGAITVIVLFALLVWRGFYIARHAPDTFTQLMVMGITAQVALQCIMNIAVVTGTMPVTGVSLPFFSYGGSSLIMLMGQMGMVLSVSRYSYQQVPEPEEENSSATEAAVQKTEAEESAGNPELNT